MQGYMGKGSGFRVNVLGFHDFGILAFQFQQKSFEQMNTELKTHPALGWLLWGASIKQIRFGVFYTRSTLWAALQICLTPKPRTLALFIPFPPCRLNSRDPGHDHPLRAEPLPCLPPQCLGMLMKLRIKASWFRI